MIKFNFWWHFSSIKFNFDQLCRNYENNFVLAYSPKLV